MKITESILSTNQETMDKWNENPQDIFNLIDDILKKLDGKSLEMVVLVLGTTIKALLRDLPKVGQNFLIDSLDININNFRAKFNLIDKETIN